MPPQETSHRTQTAILWERTPNADDYGQAIIGGPVEITVRWETVRTMMTDPQGNDVMVDATVVVDRKIAMDSEMWLGTLDEWNGTGSGSAGDDDEVMRVVAYDEVPDVKGRATWRQVGLQYQADAR